MSGAIHLIPERKQSALLHQACVLAIGQWRSDLSGGRVKERLTSGFHAARQRIVRDAGRAPQTLRFVLVPVRGIFDALVGMQSSPQSEVGRGIERGRFGGDFPVRPKRAGGSRFDQAACMQPPATAEEPDDALLHNTAHVTQIPPHIFISKALPEIGLEIRKPRKPDIANRTQNFRNKPESCHRP